MVGMCGKPKFGSHLVLNTGTIQKSNIRSDGFLIQTACIQIKVNRSSFNCIKCADKKRFKTCNIDFRMLLH